MGPKLSSSELSNSATGPGALVRTLQKHYNKLSDIYIQKDMKVEADIFAEVVKELQYLEHEIQELTES